MGSLLSALSPTAIGWSSSPSECPLRASKLSLEMSQFGATVWVDGVLLGRAPLPPLCVSGGLHLIEIQRGGRSRGGVAKRLIWAPSSGAWTLDLSDVSLTPTRSTPEPTPESTLKSASRAQSTSSTRPSPRERGAALRQEERDQRAGQDRAKTAPETAETQSETIFLSFRGAFTDLSARAPRHRTLLSAHELSLDSDQRDTPGWRCRASMLSRQDLWTGDLTLHHDPAWRSEESQLFTRRLSLGWRKAHHSLDARIEVGRAPEIFGQRSLLMDGVRAQVSWPLSARAELGAQDQWSLTVEGLIARGAERAVSFGDLDPVASPTPSQPLNAHDETGRALMRMSASRGSSLTLSTSLLIPFSSPLARPVAPSTMSTATSRELSPLLLLEARGAYELLSLNALATLYPERFTTESEARLSEIKRSLSEALLRLNLGESREGQHDWDVTLWGSWRSGDRWDQLTIPGMVWPQAYLGSRADLGGYARWSRWQLSARNTQGVAPYWHTPHLTPLRGSVRRAELSWNRARGELHAPKRRAREREGSRGLSASLVLWELQDTARRWGLNPWSAQTATSPSRRVALGLGWRSVLSLSSRAHLSLEGSVHIDPLQLTSATFDDVSALWGSTIWAEVRARYQRDQLSVSTYCGQPLELPQLPAPNLWLTQCGVTLSISALLAL